MTFTPGPWKVDEDGFVWGCCPGPAFIETAHFLVAEVRGWGYLQYRADGEQIQAGNARLIAAAPELYEALEKLFDLMISDKVSKDEGVRRLQMAADVLAKVREELEE